MAPLTRARGSFFLVDHKTHNVVWSTYAQHKNNDASEMNRLAGKIVAQLEKDLNPMVGALTQSMSASLRWKRKKKSTNFWRS